MADDVDVKLRFFASDETGRVTDDMIRRAQEGARALEAAYATRARAIEAMAKRIGVSTEEMAKRVANASNQHLGQLATNMTRQYEEMSKGVLRSLGKVQSEQAKGTQSLVEQMRTSASVFSGATSQMGKSTQQTTQSLDKMIQVVTNAGRAHRDHAQSVSRATREIDLGIGSFGRYASAAYLAQKAIQLVTQSYSNFAELQRSQYRIADAWRLNADEAKKYEETIFALSNTTGLTYKQLDEGAKQWGATEKSQGAERIAIYKKTVEAAHAMGIDVRDAGKLGQVAVRDLGVAGKDLPQIFDAAKVSMTAATGPAMIAGLERLTPKLKSAGIEGKDIGIQLMAGMKTAIPGFATAEQAVEAYSKAMEAALDPTSQLGRTMEGNVRQLKSGIIDAGTFQQRLFQSAKEQGAYDADPVHRKHARERMGLDDDSFKLLKDLSDGNDRLRKAQEEAAKATGAIIKTNKELAEQAQAAIDKAAESAERMKVKGGEAAEGAGAGAAIKGAVPTPGEVLEGIQQRQGQQRRFWPFNRPQTRAIGGPAERDQAYLVGERGAELFAPEGRGRITPLADTVERRGDVLAKQQAEADVAMREYFAKFRDKGRPMARIAMLDALIGQIDEEGGQGQGGGDKGTDGGDQVGGGRGGGGGRRGGGRLRRLTEPMGRLDTRARTPRAPPTAKQGPEGTPSTIPGGTGLGPPAGGGFEPGGPPLPELSPRQNHNDLSRDAFAKMFAGSPLADKYDSVVAAADRNNMPASLVAGIMGVETGWGKKGRALSAFNNPAGLMDPKNPKKFLEYPSLDAGIEAAARTQQRNYMKGGQTIAGMGAKYSPVGAANDPRGTNVKWPSEVAGAQKQLGTGEAEPAAQVEARAKQFAERDIAIKRGESQISVAAVTAAAGGTSAATAGRPKGELLAVKPTQPGELPPGMFGGRTQLAGATSGSIKQSINEALAMEGLTESKDQETLKKYMQTGGQGLSGEENAWCARFVNAMNVKAGLPGNESWAARSFLKWGRSVGAKEELLAGDVVVYSRGAGKGHVGKLTGETRVAPSGETEYEMLQGNVGGERTVTTRADPEGKFTQAGGGAVGTTWITRSGRGGTIAGGGRGPPIGIRRGDVTPVRQLATRPTEPSTAVAGPGAAPSLDSSMFTPGPLKQTVPENFRRIDRGPVGFRGGAAAAEEAEGGGTSVIGKQAALTGGSRWPTSKSFGRSGDVGAEEPFVPAFEGAPTIEELSPTIAPKRRGPGPQGPEMRPMFHGIDAGLDSALAKRAELSKPIEPVVRPRFEYLGGARARTAHHVERRRQEDTSRRAAREAQTDSGFA